MLCSCPSLNQVWICYNNAYTEMQVFLFSHAQVVLRPHVHTPEAGFPVMVIYFLTWIIQIRFVLDVYLMMFYRMAQYTLLLQVVLHWMIVYQMLLLMLMVVWFWIIQETILVILIHLHVAQDQPSSLLHGKYVSEILIQSLACVKILWVLNFLKSTRIVMLCRQCSYS